MKKTQYDRRLCGVIVVILKKMQVYSDNVCDLVINFVFVLSNFQLFNNVISGFLCVC